MGKLFHKCVGMLTSGEIAEYVGLELKGDRDKLLTDVCSLSEATGDQLSFLDNSKYRLQVKSSNAGAIITRESDVELLPKGTIALITPNPYVAFAKVLSMFYPALVESNISPTATIEKTAVIGKNVTIGSSCYIGENVIIRDGTYIGDNVTIICSKIGKNCIIHSGVRVGQDGFGFASTGTEIIKVPQVGHVIIGDNVEVGANTTIDRGALGATIIGDGCKLDNLVQIGHNVQMGKNCQIVAQSGIAGSTVLGDNVVIGGQSGVAGHLNIVNSVMVAARSGVTKNIDKVGAVVSGFPAIDIRKHRRKEAIISRMVKKEEKK